MTLSSSYRSGSEVGGRGGGIGVVVADRLRRGARVEKGVEGRRKEKKGRKKKGGKKEKKEAPPRRWSEGEGNTPTLSRTPTVPRKEEWAVEYEIRRDATGGVGMRACVALRVCACCVLMGE